MAISFLKKTQGGKNQCRANGPISQYSHLLSWLLHDNTTAIGINTNFICTISTQESEHVAGNQIFAYGITS